MLLDKQVKDYVKYLKEHSTAIHTAMLIAAAKEIIMNKDANLLSSNGSEICLTKDLEKNTWVLSTKVNVEEC